MLTLPVYNTQGQETESVKLNAVISDGAINKAAVYQAVMAFLANQRKGLASTKTMGEVSGGGRKPWKQKGTGRARVGSIRSPLWRHGGVIFGPHPRDFSYELPHKIKQLALRSVLCDKVKENNLVVLDSFALETPKTKEAVKVFLNLKIIPKKNEKHQKILLLLDKIDKNAKQSLHNISFLTTNLAKDTNAYEVLTHQKIVITKKGLDELTDRLTSSKKNKSYVQESKISSEAA